MGKTKFYGALQWCIQFSDKVQLSCAVLCPLVVSLVALQNWVISYHLVVVSCHRTVRRCIIVVISCRTAVISCHMVVIKCHMAVTNCRVKLKERYMRKPWPWKRYWPYQIKIWHLTAEKDKKCCLQIEKAFRMQDITCKGSFFQFLFRETPHPPLDPTSILLVLPCKIPWLW